MVATIEILQLYIIGSFSIQISVIFLCIEVVKTLNMLKQLIK